MLSLVLLAGAHSLSYGTQTVAISPDDPSEVWSLVDGWGLIYTEDGGEQWTYVCEEALAVLSINALLPMGGGVAWLGTSGGIYAYGADCGATLIGMADAQITALAYSGDGVLVGAIGAQHGGVYTCDEAGCAPTTLMGWGTSRVFVKAMFQDGARVWVSLVREESLSSELWKIEAGELSQVATWPAGDVDVRVMYAQGEHLLAWSQPRSSSDTPGLLVSTDGGASFTLTFSHGLATDPLPGLAVYKGRILLGNNIGQTWYSDDQGYTFTEATGALPAIRCGTTGAHQTWLCVDHWSDRADLMVWDEQGWHPRACLEQAELPACHDEACLTSYQSFMELGATGGGACEAPTPIDDPGCGGSGVVLLPLLLLGQLANLPGRRSPRV